MDVEKDTRRLMASQAALDHAGERVSESRQSLTQARLRLTESLRRIMRPMVAPSFTKPLPETPDELAG